VRTTSKHLPAAGERLQRRILNSTSSPVAIATWLLDLRICLGDGLWVDMCVHERGGGVQELLVSSLSVEEKM